MVPDSKPLSNSNYCINQSFRSELCVNPFKNIERNKLQNEDSKLNKCVLFYERNNGRESELYG